MNAKFSSSAGPGLVCTVLGDKLYTELGITDGHNHVWIDPVPGSDPTSPVLNQFDQICEELKRYYSAGGRTLLDCQPAGCGRNGNRLIQLSEQSQVNIIACTGFHRNRYYPADYWLFKADSETAAKYFIRELTLSLDETEGQPQNATAGFIKLALEAEWESTPQATLKGAAIAARETAAMIEIHTEKGALAEKIIPFFEKHGVGADRLVICHIDKRPDFSLHSEIARAGALLEYDTFFRPKYEPEVNLWPLIQKMVAAGLDASVVLATDMAEYQMYKTIGNGPGLESLPGEIKTRLKAIGLPDASIQKMLGENITRRLAGLI